MFAMDIGRVLLLLDIILSMSMTPVRGDYSLNMRFHSYQNPLHVAVGNGGDCCDNSDFMDPPQCSNECDNVFRFSLVICSTETVVQEVSTELIQRNNDHLVFSPGEGSTLGVFSDPVVFKGLNNSILEYMLNIDVFDDDGGGQPDLIDSIAVTFQTIALSTINFTTPSIYSGEYGFAEATLSFSLECSEYFFGKNCTIFCIDADSDAIGHYVCDDMGNRFCREGYSNPSTGCTEFASTISCSTSITFTAIMAVICILMVPTIAVITITLMKLRQRKLNAVQCKCSRNFKMKGNPSYDHVTHHQATLANEMASSSRQHTVGGISNREQDQEMDYYSNCSPYAVASITTVTTSVGLETAQ